MIATKPVISVVVCTAGDRLTLKDTLRSLAVQAGVNAYEVIVVDNSVGSELVYKQARALGFRYLREPKPGLSRARNAGFAASTADLVAFIDDDALACETWLAALVTRFENSSAAAVGGPIVPRWPNGVPEDIPVSLWGYFSIVDYGQEARLLKFPEFPFGCNMAFRRAALGAVGGFPEYLGRTGQNLLSDEEKAVFLRLDRVGMDVWYEPSAVVEHIIDARRLSARWLRRRAYQGGISGAVVTRMMKPGGSAFLRSAAGALWRMAFASMRFVTAVGPRDRLVWSVRLVANMGALVGLAHYVTLKVGRRDR